MKKLKIILNVCMLTMYFNIAVGSRVVPKLTRKAANICAEAVAVAAKAATGGSTNITATTTAPLSTATEPVAVGKGAQISLIGYKKSALFGDDDFSRLREYNSLATPPFQKISFDTEISAQALLQGGIVSVAAAAGTVLPISICAVYAGSVGCLTYQKKLKELEGLRISPYQIEGADESLLLEVGSDLNNGIGGNDGNGNNGNLNNQNQGNNNTNQSRFKKYSKTLAKAGIGALIMRGLKYLLNQNQDVSAEKNLDQQGKALEQLIDFLYSPSEKTFGAKVEEYKHVTQANPNLGLLTSYFLVHKDGKHPFVKIQYVNHIRTDDNAPPPNYIYFFDTSVSCTPAMCQQIENKELEDGDLELSLRAYRDIAQQRAQNNDERGDFAKINAGKYNNYFCRNAPPWYSYDCVSEIEFLRRQTKNDARLQIEAK